MNKLLILLPILLLTSCGNDNSSGTTLSGNITSNIVTTSDFKDEIDMKLIIDNKEIDVTWLDNDSVKALKDILPITINMHEYGGFEQTGSIGQSIVRNDTQIDTLPGDIVLYSGNAISVFYAPSSWSYTKLGHIDMTNNELNDLLNKSSIVFTLA